MGSTKIVAWEVEGELFCLQCSTELVKEYGNPVFFDQLGLKEDTCYKCGRGISLLYEPLREREEDPSDEEMGLLDLD